MMSRRGRFLFVNQFYPPDVAPTGVFLHDLARALAEAGHEVTVLCSRRAYDNEVRFPAREAAFEGVRIRRIPGAPLRRHGLGRAIGDVCFLALAAPRLLLCARRRTSWSA